MKNYIFVVMDAVRYDFFIQLYKEYLGEYLSNTRLYTNMWSSSCWTVPAIGSLITGKSPLEHKAMLETDCNLDPDIPILYDYFLEEGYKNYYLSANQMFNSTFLDRFQASYAVICGEEKWDHHDLLTHGNELIAGLKGSTKPFFLYTHLMDAHRPYPCIQPECPSIVERLNQSNGWKFFYAHHINLSQKMRSLYRKMYAKGVMDCLNGVKKIFEIFKEHLDNTCIVILSDHGEMLGEHDLFDHQFNLYNECVKIPMLVFDKGSCLQPEFCDNLYSIQNVWDLLIKGDAVDNEEIYAYYSKPERILRSQACEELLVARPDLMRAIKKKIWRDGSSELEYTESLFPSTVSRYSDAERIEIEEKLEQLGYL